MIGLVGSGRRSVGLLATALDCAMFSILPLAQTAAAQGAPASHRVVVLDDNLSTGYDLMQGTGWVVLPDRRLKGWKPDYSVANASISGDTTAGGCSHLPAVLAREEPSAVVLELGGNNALHSLSLTSSEGSMGVMIEASQVAGTKMLLVSMRIPPNYGPSYSEHFFAMLDKLAQQYKLPLVPFLLKGVAQQPDWFQEDRIHPIAAAQPTMLSDVWPKLEPLLKAWVGR